MTKSFDENPKDLVDVFNINLADTFCLTQKILSTINFDQLKHMLGKLTDSFHLKELIKFVINFALIQTKFKQS